MSATNRTRIEQGTHPRTDQLMELVVSKANMALAYKRVLSNRGSAGIDKMRVEDLKSQLQARWSEIKVALLSDAYYPQAVRAVEIPKSQGGKRKLGIPTVVDRLIQQAVHQVLSPLYEPTFSDNSYGFRPGRSAQQAVKQSQRYINEERRWVVDLDLSKFFDEVHHDRLLSKLRLRIADRRVIHLIDRYLRVGIMADGIAEQRTKGTPQGSPLSPLLSNIVLDELDEELEKRGLRFVRYADDFQIYVSTERSAKRVKSSVTAFLESRLRLKVNESKSAVDRPWKRNFLGYGFTNNKEVKLKVAKESIRRLRKKVKAKFRQGKGRNLFKFIKEDLNPILRGWINYFSLSEVKGFAKDLDSWIRRHLRKVRWQQWKRNWTRLKELMRRGLKEEHAVQSAFNRRGAWWNAGSSHMNRAYPTSYFDKIGLVSLAFVLNRTSHQVQFRNRRDT